jgi:hypothetical protein
MGPNPTFIYLSKQTDDDADDDDDGGGVRISELPFDPHFLNAVCSSLPTSTTKTVFQSLHLPLHP